MDDIINKFLNICNSIWDKIIAPYNNLIRFLRQYLNALTIVYIFLFILGILIFIYGALKEKERKQQTILKKLVGKRMTSSSLLDNLIDHIPNIAQLENKLDSKINILDKEMSPRKIIKKIILGMTLAIIFAIYINNIVAAIPLMAIGYFIPLIMLDIKVKKKRSLLEEQLCNAIKLFVTEFTTNASVYVALNNISDAVKNPLKGELERLLRKINSGEPRSECFMDFAKRLNNKWAYIFAKLVIDYIENGTDFTDNLIHISNSITEEKIQYKESSAELTLLKSTNLLINAAIPLVYFINKIMNPDQARIFVETGTGKLIMIFVIIGSFISLLLGLKIENI